MPTIEKTIKLETDYEKLHGQRYAKLLSVFNDAAKELLTSKMPDLLYFDTLRSDLKQEFLAPGDYIILVFVGEKGIMFTHIVPASDENIKKYNDSIGENFFLVIK